MRSDGGEAETLLKELLQVVSKDHPDLIVAMLGHIYVRTATGRMEESDWDWDCLKVLDVIAREKMQPRRTVHDKERNGAEAWRDQGTRKLGIFQRLPHGKRDVREGARLGYFCF